MRWFTKNHSTQDAVSYFTDRFRKGIACSRRLDSGEQVKSYAASAKRNRALSFARSAPPEREARKGIDEGCVTAAVFVNFRKAFDSVNHQLILKKSPGYSIKNNELRWFENYLILSNLTPRSEA